ncbi:MAG: hypothetical protein QOI66_5177 [Myxococcales bacterium]|nr:hypothetical protein [Myxococcales bacterium]
MAATERRRGRTLVLCGAAGAVLLAALLIRGSRPGAPAAPAPVADDTAPSVPPSSRAPSPPAQPAADGAPGAPIIDEVRVEKPVVCEGEENLITIRAHTPQGKDDAFLSYVVGEAVGRSVPLHAYLPPPGQPEAPQRIVSVFGRNGVATRVPVPAYQVKHCPPDYALAVTYRQMPNAHAEFELLAKISVPKGKTSFAATTFHWLFGDGRAQDTNTPSVVHQFATHGQSLDEQFLIAVDAKNAAGSVVRGRLSLPVRDDEFEALALKDMLVLSKELNPRFPQMDAQHQVKQSVRVFHHRPQPVHLEQVVISYRAVDGSAPLPPETKPAAALFGTSELPPDPGIELTLNLDLAQHPTVAMVDYYVTGTTKDGLPVYGEFSVMRPAEQPSPQTGQRVMDPILVEKIKRARAALAKSVVNDEDLRTLANRGDFDDLPSQESAPHPRLDGKALHATTRAEERARAAK